MTITSTSTVTTDISYVVSQSSGNTQRSDNDSLGYAIVFSQGTGIAQVNAHIKATGVISSGQTFTIDFEAVPKETFGSTYNINMKEVKSFVMYNEGTGTSDVVLVRATGTNGITGIFNGETGNYKLNPYGSFVYADYYGDMQVSTTHRYLHFVNTSEGAGAGNSGNINYSYILIGVTG
jgi:hypothetical protein